MEQDNEYNMNNISIGKRLGKGSFGEVFSGTLSDGRKIAIKRVSQKNLEKAKGGYLFKAFFRELECMKKCNCENSVILYNDFKSNNNFNIIMELCDGDLDHELRKRPEGFKVEEVRYIMSQLNNAFKKMVENNIIHRDLKLQNILIKYIDEEKTKFIPKLSDYGFSKIVTEKYTGTVLGTPATMAPEIMNKQEYNNKVDLWSIGVLLYQLHFNEYPYKGKIQEIKKNIRNKVPYKQPEDYFLRDLINKLLVENPIYRLSWEEYFQHPFFMSEEKRNEILNKINNNENDLKKEVDVVYIDKEKKYIYQKDFDTGFKSDMYKCVIAKDAEKKKLVFIKIYNNEFVNSHQHVFKNEFNLYRTFDKNNNVLQLKKIIKEKETYLIFHYVDCEILSNYIIHHGFDEKEFQIFNNELYENVFNYSQIYFKPFIFLSLFSFAITKEGKPILFDMGLHKLLLSSEEVLNYYLPNKSEIVDSLYPVKTNIMNYGITLLKCFYENNMKLGIEGNEIILPTNKTLSNNFKKFLSKCLIKNILKRSTWTELKNEEFMNNITDDSDSDEDANKIDGEFESLISDKKLKGILRSLDKKYELINNYYDSIEIKINSPYIEEMEKFLILILFEQLILSKILNQEENSKYNDMTKEISFIDIIKAEAHELRINFASPALKYMKIFSNNIENESIKEFIPKLNKHILKLKEVLKKVHSITQSKYFKSDYRDFLKEFSDLMRNGIVKLRDYFLTLTKEANNDYLNKNYKNAELKAPIAEYLSEIILFLVMSIIDIEKEKICFNKKDLLKQFKEIFEKENEDNVEVSCIKFAKEKDKYILVSFLGILFRYLINSYDINQINIKSNKDSLSKLLESYQKLMKTLVDIN